MEVWDNSEGKKLGSHLQERLKSLVRMDAAVGYLNLRGREDFVDIVDAKAESSSEKGAVVRVLVGMAVRSSHQQAMRELDIRPGIGADPVIMDHEEGAKRKRELVKQLGQQLHRGLPLKKDIETLRALSRQISEGLVELKVYTRTPLHGKTARSNASLELL